MRKRMTLFVTIIMVMAFVCGLATVSAFAVIFHPPWISTIKIVWEDNSNAAGKRPETILFKDVDDYIWTIDVLDSDYQYCRVGKVSPTEDDFPDVENYSKSVKDVDDDAEYGSCCVCTYTYTGETDVIDVTVPEVIAFVADENGNFTSDVNIKNNSSIMSVETELSAEAYGDWSLVSRSTDFDSMGDNQKKFSLIAVEPGVSEIDLSAGAYTFDISNLGSADFILKGKTGPVTENIDGERCVTVGLYVTESL